VTLLICLSVCLSTMTPEPLKISLQNFQRINHPLDERVDKFEMTIYIRVMWVVI